MAPWTAVTAASDAALSASAVRTFVALHDALDSSLPRPVKLVWLARKARVSRAGASAALEQLLARRS